MKESSKEVKKAVLVFGEYLGLKESTTFLIKNDGIDSTIRRLVYIAFVKHITDYFVNNGEVYEAIQIIRNYCKEMELNGKVIFGEKFNNS